jgi:hypothetical protein
MLVGYVVVDGLADVDCILNCDGTSRLPSGSSEKSYLELPIVVSDIVLSLYVCRHQFLYFFSVGFEGRVIFIVGKFS